MMTDRVPSSIKILGGIAILVIAFQFFTKGGTQGGFTGSRGMKDHFDGDDAHAKAATLRGGKSSIRHEDAAGILDLSGKEAARAFTLHESSRQFLKDAELKRATVFSQYKDADGNSSSTMMLEQPTAEELDQICADYLNALSEADREFVEQTGLSSNIRSDIADFFTYGSKYRYVTFLLAGDGSATLPSVLVMDSDKLYSSDQASGGKLEVPAEELHVKDYGDLKIGDPKLDRYGRLFSIR